MHLGSIEFDFFSKKTVFDEMLARRLGFEAGATLEDYYDKVAKEHKEFVLMAHANSADRFTAPRRELEYNLIDSAGKRVRVSTVVDIELLPDPRFTQKIPTKMRITHKTVED